jgi:uncharacterized protein YbjQ (UPF0145 family)
MDLIVFLIFLGAVYVIGSSIEKNHFRRIIEREKLIMQQPHTTDDFTLTPDTRCKKITLVTGSCVIGADYFKMFVAGLRSWFGGPLTTYEGLLDRARREAVLRMRESAAGADMVVQTRICTNEIKPGVVEINAYGTAIYLAK